MANCINASSKEYKELLEQTKLNPLILKARISIFQDKNGLESFPKVEDIIQSNEVNYQKNQTVSNKGIIASEKTIRDLAAKIADRIGMTVKFESDRSKEYKGKIENNVAYVNLAHATLDTPIHEILGHPIIRVIKGTNNPIKWANIIVGKNEDFNGYYVSYTNVKTSVKEEIFTFEDEVSALEYKQNLERENFNYSGNRQLYQNLLKELETGRGKEVLDRIKKDYNVKSEAKNITSEKIRARSSDIAYLENYIREKNLNPLYDTIEPILYNDKIWNVSFEPDGENGMDIYFYYTTEAQNLPETYYSLEEQQEEAIVELLGLMTAEKLDNVKDGKLISLLKRLLKEMKAFIRTLINQKEIEIDKLPDNMILSDLADVLAYSNSKLILPGYEVEYTTPDNSKFKTYQEASNHISELAKSVEDIDLDSIKVENQLPERFVLNEFDEHNATETYYKENGQWYLETQGDTFVNKEKITEEKAKKDYSKYAKYQGNLNSFIEKNKEYEQSKEIIEEWKKVNNIVYNPEEIYSRGQEFSSVVGAYSDFDVDLMMQNLLAHIEDNEKAGGKFAISAYTKPVDKQIGHLEGGGGKIKFKLYPQSNDILWASNIDVYSGSVWDASEKVNKDKKSELLGVSYTKYPSLRNVNTVQPNLASIVDKLDHHHNELGISLTGNNFRLEYDEDIPYTTKKIIDGINKILDQKYGKLVKPEIQESRNFINLKVDYNGDTSFKTINTYEDDVFRYYDISDGNKTIKGLRANEFNFIDKVTKGIQPTQTNETLKENIKDISGKLQYKSVNTMVSTTEFPNNKVGDVVEYQGKQFKILTEQPDAEYSGYDYELSPLDKPVYTEQALINTKIAALKEVAKAQPRSLIKSEVKLIEKVYNSNYDYNDPFEDLPFQKIPSVEWSNITSEKEDIMFPDTISEETVTEPKPNNNVKNLFGESESKTLTASEVLTNLINSDVFENSKDVAFFLQQTMNLLGKSGAKFKLITEKSNKQVYGKFDDKSVMMYDSVDNTIYVTNTSLNNFDEVTIASSFIHEVTHSTTVQAYFNPKTFEEKQFKEFIDKSFNQYKYLATKRDENGKLMYGFTNQAEFIAEIYSNPKFREHLQTLEKSWWSQFVDTIRRLFGMSKNIFNTELINSAILFEVIDEFATRNKSNWKGTLVNDPRYDKFGTDFFNKVEKPENSTLQDKINNLVNSQINNIEVILRRANSMRKKFGTKNQNFINQINELDRVVNESVKTNKLKAINHYTDFMVTQIDHIFTTIKNGSKASKLDQLETIERYKSYLGASDMLEPIMDTLNDTRTKDLTDEELLIVNTIQDKLTAISGAHEQIKSKFRTHTVEALRQELKGSYFSEKVVQDFREEIGKDYPKDSSLSKKEWVNQQILERQDELTERVEKDVNEVLDGMSTDIDGTDKNLFSALNTKSRLIQILAKVIAKMKNKMDSLIRDNDFELNSLYQNLIKEKGKYDITNLYEQSEDGTTYIKGEYSVKFRDLYINEYSKYLDEVNELKEKHRAAGFNEFEINQFKDVNDIYRKIAEWRNKHTVKVGNTLLPNSMYKNKNNFSPAEKAIYNKYKELAKNSEAKFGKNNSLIKTSLVDYYTLPYATVSSLERVATGRMNIKDTIKQKVTDITNWKIDDLENNSEEMYRQDGTRIFNIPIMYRNNVSKTKEPKKYAELIKEQSYDLLTLLRLEHYNQTNFDVRSENEMVLNAFVEVSKNKKYLKTKLGTNNLVSNLFGIKTKYVEFKGIESNEYQRIQSIVEQTLYNKFYEEGLKVFGKDANKLVQSANKHTSFLGMTLNYFNAPVNVLNAEFQTFMIKLGGDINKGMIREAHLFYAKDLPNIVADTGRPNKMSFVNQFNLVNDIFGGLTHEQNDFVKNTILKGIADPQMLQILQNGGEHMVQSVLNIAVSKSIKVMNDKGQYINKDGNVVSEKDAASLFDMVEQDPTTKQIKYNTKFTYTDKSSVTKWNEGGSENVRLFIKKKIFDSMGEYDKNFQTEIQRHWWGQLLMMYKKFIIPLGIARYRGAGSALKKKTDLTEEDRHWNESLQQYEEGYYITTFRFMARGMVQNLVKLKFDLISQDYNNLSDYEKANLKKGIVEISVLIMLQMVIVPLLVGMAAGDDDEDLMFLAMLSRKLEQELSFYTDLNDAYKVTKDPVASLNTIESFLDVAKFTISPGLWFSEDKAGTPRVYKVLEKVSFPTALRPDKTAKTVLQGMNQGLVGPYEEGIFYRLMNE